MTYIYTRFLTATAKLSAVLLLFVLLPTDPATAAEETANATTATNAEQTAADAQPENLPVKVKMSTNLGELTIELYPEKAPATVANFLQYVSDGQYVGTVFHRVIEGFMIQGGGFTLNLEKKDTREPVQNEADNQLKNDRYTIAMARTRDPHSATAQFFINAADNDFLNHQSKDSAGWGYTVFGRVIEGQDVVDWISKTPTGANGPFPKDVPTTPIVIESVEALSNSASTEKTATE